MSRVEKRVLALVGALGTAMVAAAAAIQGANIAESVGTGVQVLSLVLTGGGGALLAGGAYYKAAITE